MGFLVDGQNRTLLTGSLSADQWVTTPYLFNAGGSVQVPAPQAPDTFGIVSGVQTWSAKTFLQPIVTSGSFTSPVIQGTVSISQCACTLSTPAIASGTFTKPVISSATMTSPTIAGGGTWTSGTITSGTIQSGTFTSPTVAMGTASFMTIQSGVLQTCKLTSPAIALTGGQASGGVIANAITVLPVWGTSPVVGWQHVPPLDLSTAQLTQGAAFYSGPANRNVLYINIQGLDESLSNAMTGQLYYCIIRRANSSVVGWTSNAAGRKLLIAGASAFTPGTNVFDVWTVLYDGSNYLCVDKQLNVR